jgi:hypothetical protein
MSVEVERRFAGKSSWIIAAALIAFSARASEQGGMSADSGGFFDTRETALQSAKENAVRALRSICAWLEGEISYADETCHAVPGSAGGTLWSCTVSARVTCTLCPDEIPRA